MTAMTKQSHTTKWIPVGELSVVWAEAQRPLDRKRVERIEKEFDPDMFDDLVVARVDGNGRYHVVDGQHRRAAVRKLYGNDEMVPCRIVDADSPEKAANIFLKINQQRKAPSVIERFKAAVTAGYEAETRINKLVRELGFKVAAGPVPGNIQSVGALLQVYNAHGFSVLRDTLMVIKGTWGDEPAAVSANIIRGYGAFLAAYAGAGGKDFWTRLRERVAKSGSANALIGRAHTLKESYGCSMTEAVKEQLIITYNAGLRVGKLKSKRFA